MTTIIGMKLTNRVAHAGDVQKVLTNSGCSIKTRIGLHNEGCGCGQCSPNGLILLEIPNDEEAVELVKQLCEIEGVEIQQMKF